MVISPRQSLLVAALALVPVVIYGVGRNDPITAVTAGTSVLLVIVALYVAFSPADGRDVGDVG